MQLLRENYQLFKPDTPFSNVRGYRNAYFEEVNSLTKRTKQYWNDAVRFKMQINGKYYYFANYSLKSYKIFLSSFLFIFHLHNKIYHQYLFPM